MINRSFSEPDTRLMKVIILCWKASAVNRIHRAAAQFLYIRIHDERYHFYDI
jgi:hypothetical protein